MILDKLLEFFEKYFIRSGWKKARFYKKFGYFHSIGENCYIPIHISRRETYLTAIGNNVWLTNGTKILNHDASVKVVRIALNTPWLDKVDKIEIGNNVFVGNDTIILPGVSIGDNCIIGAGSVVSKDVPSNSVCAGNPIRKICSIEEYADKCISRTSEYTWNEFTSHKDLKRMRINFFWQQNKGEK